MGNDRHRQASRAFVASVLSTVAWLGFPALALKFGRLVCRKSRHLSAFGVGVSGFGEVVVVVSTGGSERSAWARLVLVPVMVSALLTVSLQMIVAQAGAQYPLALNPRMSLYQAGGLPSADGGIPPLLAMDGLSGGQVLNVAAEGTWDICGQCVPVGPDGVDYPTVFTINTPTGSPISGFKDVQIDMLAGVFLGPGLPTLPAPPMLENAGYATAADLYPVVAQTFPVGDGLTPSGQTQRIHVPAGATRFYLGIIDGYNDGSVCCYGDNAGSGTAQVNLDPGAGYVNSLRERLGSADSMARHGDPVNTASGSFFDSWTDLGSHGGVFGLGVSRAYNSVDSSSSVLGVGWRSGFSQTAVVEPGGGVGVTLEDGRLVRFPVL
ncbi:MAG TPA: DUF6531 domain-containing protein, partial [Microthrixaceae bacterium]|nr:DUF6531 domain-containing protein [Microthrixaceae bacterium]HMT61817.1 DUF6531 domain-containing protein [Microthrixaceae bacterium]